MYYRGLVNQVVLSIELIAFMVRCYHGHNLSMHDDSFPGVGVPYGFALM